MENTIISETKTVIDFSSLKNMPKDIANMDNDERNILLTNLLKAVHCPIEDD